MTASLTPPEHEHNALVEQAAQWLSDQAIPPRPIVPELRKRFDISALEACEAAALAEKFRMLRRAFG
ncbi:hypothetical protein [Sinorhizobium fredii]|uniref:hypothetical protein n=1 Tax=Rhizobium fredii TaxID=380 RepID=UPI0004BA2232|nr:hypothetical protein [Sinorhizobium fredii]